MPEIIYEDNDIIVINKPAGIATQTKKVGEKDMVSELKNYLKGGFVGVVHRLDQPVCGILVFAKNKKSAAELSRQVSEKGESGFQKDYKAIVFPGGEIKEKDVCEDLIVKEKEGFARIVKGCGSGSDSEGKTAKLSYEKIGEVTIGNVACPVLSVHLETGRFHQIRVQLAHRKLPIIGDMKYGSTESIEHAKKEGIRQLKLCADHLRLRHPSTGRTMDFEIDFDR